MLFGKYSLSARVMSIVKEVIKNLQASLDAEIKALEVKFEEDKEAAVQRHVDKVINSFK